MDKAKVGFMAITCPTHIEATNELGDRWVDVAVVSRAVEALRSRGLEVLEHPQLVDSVEGALRAMESLRQDKVDCVLIFIATWNWAAQVMQAAQQVSLPIILWAFPVPSAWSIGGLAVTHGSFDEVGIRHKVVYGFPEEPGVTEEIVNYAQGARVAHVLRRSQFGSIGGPGMGIHTGVIDANQWLKEFGILVGYSDEYAVVVEGEKVPKEKIEALYNDLKGKYGAMPSLDTVTERAIRVYLGLEKIIEKNSYDFIAVKCTFDLSDNYCTACLAQSLLGTRGFVTTCLNDANGALTTYILRLLTDDPLFTADVNLVQRKEKIVRLIDDGAGSFKLARDPKEVRLSYQPTLEAKASGVCTSLVCKPGPITLARLARVKGKYQMHIVGGEAFEGEESWLEECGYPMWPHAFIYLDGDPEIFVQNLRSEYIHMAYGDLRKQLIEVCGVLDIKPILS